MSTNIDAVFYKMTIIPAWKAILKNDFSKTGPMSCKKILKILTLTEIGVLYTSPGFI